MPGEKLAFITILYIYKSLSGSGDKRSPDYHDKIKQTFYSITNMKKNQNRDVVRWFLLSLLIWMRKDLGST